MKKKTYISPSVAVTRLSSQQILAGSVLNLSDKQMNNSSALSVRDSFFDVYEEEDENVFENREDDILNNSITARLLSFPNVIVTSHQGFLTKEALEAISTTTIENAISFENGNPIDTNVVK